MDKISLVRQLLTQGENNSVEFKSAGISADSLAKEIVAFSNTYGGHILIGVEDDGSISGIDLEEKNWEEWIANISQDSVNPALSNFQFDIKQIDNKSIICLYIEKGKLKPYYTNKNQYFVRVGSTNRVTTQSELMRLFQESGVFHYDKISIEQSKFSSLDLNKVARYFDFFEIKFEEEDVVNILKNIDVLDDLGEHLTVGGNLVFGINPQKFMPEAVISFGRFKGNEISSELIDKKNF
jgi:ATP-dependent DNA helicase RecG